MPRLRGLLGSEAIIADVRESRPSAAGVEVLGSLLAPEHDVVVFDLGTNDDSATPAALAADLARARELSGGRCLVVATLNRPPLNGVSVGGLNRAVAAFAARDPRVRVVDWHGAVAAEPELVFDGVHSDTRGYALRARLFAEAIASCGAPEEPDGGRRSEAHRPQPKPRPVGRRPRPPSPVEALAGELAKAIGVGAEFG